MTYIRIYFMPTTTEYDDEQRVGKSGIHDCTCSTYEIIHPETLN